AGCQIDKCSVNMKKEGGPAGRTLGGLDGSVGLLNCHARVLQQRTVVDVDHVVKLQRAIGVKYTLSRDGDGHLLFGEGLCRNAELVTAHEALNRHVHDVSKVGNLHVGATLRRLLDGDGIRLYVTPCCGVFHLIGTNNFFNVNAKFVIIIATRRHKKGCSKYKHSESMGKEIHSDPGC